MDHFKISTKTRSLFEFKERKNHILYNQKWAIHYACVRIHSNKYEKDKKKRVNFYCVISVSIWTIFTFEKLGEFHEI